MMESNQRGRKPQPQTRKFNFIYKHIVEDDDDLVGMIAYSFYKKEKIRLIDEFVKQHGRQISEADLHNIHQQLSTPYAIQGLRQKAKEKLEVFFNILLEGEVEAFKEAQKESIHEYYQYQIKNFHQEVGNQVNIVREDVKKLDKSYLHGISQEIVGAFAVIFILVVITFVPRAADIGFSEAFESLTGWELRQKKPQDNKIDSIKVERNAPNTQQRP